MNPFKNNYIKTATIYFIIIAVILVFIEALYFINGAMLDDGSSEGGEIDYPPLLEAPISLLPRMLWSFCKQCMNWLIIDAVVVGIVTLVIYLINLIWNGRK